MNKSWFVCLGLLVGPIACGASTTPGEVGADARSEVGVDANGDEALDAQPIDVAPLDVRPEVGADIVDVPRDMPPDTGRSLTFVLDELVVEASDGLDLPHTGFNLDGLFSGPTDADGCNHDDFFSLYDRDQHRPARCTRGTAGCVAGVDNQLPTVFNTIESVSGMSPRAVIAGEVANNRLVVLVHVTSVEDLVDDPDIRVRVFIGFPTFSTGCTSVQPDREYVVDRRSLIAGGTTLGDAIVDVRGRIVSGRLQFAAGAGDVFRLPIPLGAGLSTAVGLRALHMRFDVTDIRGTHGNLGGWATGQDLVDAIVMLAPMYRAAVEGILGSLVDIQDGGICVARSGSRARYGGVSMGMEFTALPVRIREMDPIVDAPPPGTCGAM